MWVGIIQITNKVILKPIKLVQLRMNQVLVIPTKILVKPLNTMWIQFRWQASMISFFKKKLREFKKNYKLIKMELLPKLLYKKWTITLKNWITKMIKESTSWTKQRNNRTSNLKKQSIKQIKIRASKIWATANKKEMRKLNKLKKIKILISFRIKLKHSRTNKNNKQK